jgi:hypothetical protein
MPLRTVTRRAQTQAARRHRRGSLRRGEWTGDGARTQNRHHRDVHRQERQWKGLQF